MKKAALVLGIVGGSIGAIGAVLLMAVGGAALIFGGGFILVWGFFGLVLSGMAIVGGSIAEKNANTAGILLLVAGVLNFVFLSVWWIPSGLMCLVGGILALAAPPEVHISPTSAGPAQPTVTPPATQPSANAGGYCPSCGTSVRSDSRFCEQCGRSIS